MPNIAVFMEQRGGQIKKVAWQMISEARRLADAGGGEVWGVFLGPDAGPATAEAGKYGADKVFAATGEVFSTYNSEAWGTALASHCARAGLSVRLWDREPEEAQADGLHRVLVGHHDRGAAGVPCAEGVDDGLDRIDAEVRVARQVADVQHAGRRSGCPQMQRRSRDDITAPGAFDAHLRTQMQAQVTRPARGREPAKLRKLQSDRVHDAKAVCF